MENIDNNEHVPHESPFDHHKMTLKPTSLEKPGIFQQFIKSLIHSNDAVESKISKKVCCHTENANKVQHQLKQIRDELKEEIEDELFPMIAEVINPLLRDVNRIDRMMKRENGELAAIKEYQVWTEGAKLWVELYSKNKDKETIKAAIVKHIINKSMDRIERDIRFIEDYFQQSIEQLNLSPDGESRFKSGKRKSLLVQIEKLRSLQVIPDPITFESVSSWRQKLDDQRAKYFEAALHKIDS